MMKARIRITTRTLENCDLFEGEGELSPEGDGAKIRYRIEGDDAFLHLAPRRISMRREGEVTLFGEFSEGENSSLSMDFAGNCARLPVFTNVCRCEISARGAAASLDYSLDLGEKQTFSLEIFILTTEES